MTACRATDNGYVCNKSAGHVGEHAARNQFAFDGPILHRWPNAPTAAPDHGPLAATLSDRTLAKVLSRPAYVPRDTPSLVELDRREAEAARTKEWERVMSAAIEWEYADAYPDSPAAKDATVALDDLRAVVRAYRESEAARRAVQS